MTKMPPRDPDGNAYPKYPRVSDVQRLKKVPTCYLCGDLCSTAATRMVTVQTGWTRGDDETYYLCDDHEPAELRHRLVMAKRAAMKAYREAQS